MTTMEKLEEAWELVHDALDAALDEAESWEAIEAWQSLDEKNELIAHRAKKYGDRYWVTLSALDESCEDFAVEEEFSGASRVEALKNAAAWCRKEMAK